MTHLERSVQRKHWMPMRSARPRTFKEVVAAQDPTEMARLARGDRFVDPSVNAFHGEVSVNEDRFGTGEWRVEYFDMMAAATLRSSPVLQPRGGRATISTHSNLVALVSKENPSHSGRSRMPEIPRGAIFGPAPPRGAFSCEVECARKSTRIF
jgi:hypothetical protein